LQCDIGINENIGHRIRAGWMKWRQIYDILYDKKVLNKLKDKFHQTTIRPVMIYNAEYWATKGQHIQKMNITEMQILRWICDHTRRD
jgi:hypothetical protein